MLRAEILREGFLVRGTENVEKAIQSLEGLFPRTFDRADVTWSHGGRWRKVPAQWSDWGLSEWKPNTSQHGTFVGVVIHIKDPYLWQKQNGLTT